MLSFTPGIARPPRPRPSAAPPSAGRHDRKRRQRATHPPVVDPRPLPVARRDAVGLVGVLAARRFGPSPPITMCFARSSSPKPVTGMSRSIASVRWRLTRKTVTIPSPLSTAADVEIGDVVRHLAVIGRRVHRHVERRRRGRRARRTGRDSRSSSSRRARPFSARIGAMTFTSCAMQAIFTRSERRMNSLSRQPMKSASSRL